MRKLPKFDLNHIVSCLLRILRNMHEYTFGTWSLAFKAEFDLLAVCSKSMIIKST